MSSRRVEPIVVPTEHGVSKQPRPNFSGEAVAKQKMVDSLLHLRAQRARAIIPHMVTQEPLPYPIAVKQC
jgi:hypothetical protein